MVPGKLKIAGTLADTGIQLYEVAEGLVIHMVNFDYEITAGKSFPQLDIVLELNLAGEVSAVTMYSPDFAGEQRIDFTRNGGTLIMKIPRLDVWNVIEIDFAS